MVHKLITYTERTHPLSVQVLSEFIREFRIVVHDKVLANTSTNICQVADHLLHECIVRRSGHPGNVIGTRCKEHYKQNVIGCHAAGITFTRKRTDPFPLANLLPSALSAAISGISKNSPGTGLATLRLDSESVKMPIQVVRDVADFIVSPP